jgi:hypothetical protein
MTDLATTEAPVSTTLEPNDTPSVSGGGTPHIEAAEPARGPSLRDTVAAEFKADAKEAKPADEAADKKPAEKPQEGKEAEAKPETAKEPAKGSERSPDGKFAPKQAEGDEPKPEGEAEVKETQSKPQGHIDPPKNFLPDAKETWRNTPRAVQRDVENTIRTYEAKVAEFSEIAERYEPIREYDDFVRQNGRAGVHETLQEVTQLENLMLTNPIAGLNQALLRAGPRKPDGQPYSLFEVAQTIVNSGQDNYHKTVSQAKTQQTQEQREDPRIAQLEQQLAKVQQQQLAATVIEPFKADHPRYEELKGDIAFFLQSGKIPTSLSQSDRLAAAYDMAARINPASHGDEAAAHETSPEPRDRAVSDLSGSKSIKSAPGAVSSDMEPDRGGSIRDLLSAELKRAKRS